MTYNLCKMKLPFNRESDTVHNVVLNPRKTCFRASRKSVSYFLDEATRRKVKVARRVRGIRVTRVRKMARDDTVESKP